MSRLWLRDGDDTITSSIPMYQRLYTVLREEIRDGRYPSEEPMPTEALLAERFAVSRITVRKTLEHLQRDGYVTKRRGVGTFATEPEMRPPSEAARPFMTNLEELWSQTTMELVEFGTMPAPRYVADRLEIDTGTEVNKASRVRSYREQPIGMLTTFIPMTVARDFAREDMETMSVMDLLKRSGHLPVTAVQRISARAADPFAATCLKCEIGTPLLSLGRVSRDSAGRPVTYLRTLYLPDQYEIELEMEVGGPGHRGVWGMAEK